MHASIQVIQYNGTRGHPSIAQSCFMAVVRFCDVVEESPESARRVATADMFAHRISIICLQFVIKLPVIVLGQSRLPNERNLYFALHGPVNPAPCTLPYGAAA